MQIIVANHQIEGDRFALLLSEEYTFTGADGIDRTTNRTSVSTSLVDTAVLNAKAALPKGAQRKNFATMAANDICDVLEGADLDTDERGFITAIKIDLVSLGFTPVKNEE